MKAVKLDMIKRTFFDWIRIMPLIKSNTIPPKPKEWGTGWDQPELHEIQICDKFATMSKRTFDKLINMCGSYHRTVYEGKMCKSTDDKKTYYLHWYGYSNEPDKVSNNVREIKII